MAKELPGLSGAIRRFTTAAAAVAAGAVLVAGCAAGQVTQTINQRPAIDGASADAGAVSIRTAAVVDDQGGSFTKGGSAQLQMVIINNGAQQLELQSVSSPLAGSAQVSSTGASSSGSSSAQSSSAQSSSAQSSSAQSSSATVSAPGSSSVSSTPSATATTSASSSTSAGTSASGSASPGGSASPSSSDTASASASSSAQASTPIPIPAGGSVQVGFDTSGPSITLTGLTADLYPAQNVPVTLTFADGSTVSLTVPVQLPSSAPSAPVVSDATEPAEPRD